MPPNLRKVKSVAHDRPADGHERGFVPTKVSKVPIVHDSLQNNDFTSI